jgi:hypothetical protein
VRSKVRRMSTCESSMAWHTLVTRSVLPQKRSAACRYLADTQAGAFPPANAIETTIDQSVWWAKRAQRFGGLSARLTSLWTRHALLKGSSQHDR